MAHQDSDLYTPSVPATGAFQNRNLNELSSAYANDFGHNTSALIRRITKSLIFDAAPQQFFDLKLLAMKPFENVDSDEWNFMEMGYGRDPLQITATYTTAAGVVTANITVHDSSVVSEDTIIILPDNSKATVTNIVNATTVEITMLDITGTAPDIPTITVPAGASVNLANLSPVEADGADDISQYFRIGTIERYNYVQMLVKAMRFGKMELFKYRNAGSTSNYLSMQKQRMIQQFRIDLSNILWNGQRGEVTLANGQVAKTTGGIYPALIASGPPAVSTPAASVDSALESLALSTEFKAYGATRFLYGSPTQLHNLSQLYKRSATRYTPNDEIAKLQLTAVDIGSSKIVFVPMRRFEDAASFPADWANRLILLDQEAVTCVQTWGEEMGETLNRRDGGTLQNYQDFWISTTMGVQFNNPLGSGIIDVT